MGSKMLVHRHRPLPVRNCAQRRVFVNLSNLAKVCCFMTSLNGKSTIHQTIPGSLIKRPTID
jgi:hypothetical protein